MKRRRWTGQEIQVLAERYVEEGPIQLALELGRSEDSVSSFAHRCGFRTRRWLERVGAEQIMPQNPQAEPVTGTDPLLAEAIS